MVIARRDFPGNAEEDAEENAPGLLSPENIDAAKRCLRKGGYFKHASIVLAHMIVSAEAAGDDPRADKLYRERSNILDFAQDQGASDVAYFHLHLFSFYVTRGALDKAGRIFRDGKGYGVGKHDYGMLWVRFCDLSWDIEEGLEAMRAYFRDREKPSPRQMDALRARYPNLARAKGFDEIQSR